MFHRPMVDRPATRRPSSGPSPRLVGLTVLSAAALGMAGMAPEPDPIPRRWELELEAGSLRSISLITDDRGNQDPSDDLYGDFLFLTYRVTNYTGRDLFFAPTFTLTNDSGEILRSGQGVPADVTSRLLAELDQAFLQSEFEVLGVLHQGPENARDVVVIWPLNDRTIDEAAVYAAGFSGEAKGYRVLDPQTGDFRTETLRKTYMIRYGIPGEINPREPFPFHEVERRWVMR